MDARIVDGRKIARVTDGGSLQVTQSGNIVASETLFPEETRTATTGYSTLKTCPNGARGFAISLTIRGVTGTFGSGEGVGLNVRIRNDADRLIFNQLTEKTNVLNCCHVVTMYPGLQEAPLPVTGSRLVHINAFSIGSVDAQIQVTGTFGSGEGVVCSAKVIWLL